MKAAVYYGPCEIHVEDCPEPTPTSDNLIAQVHCCAICGTDVKLATIGHRVSLFGNIDPVGVLQNGSAEELEAEIRRQVTAPARLAGLSSAPAALSHPVPPWRESTSSSN